MTREAATPLMQQYREIKARHQDAILFFRMGDFYEMFYDDAEVASRVLGLTLTARNNGGAAEVPLAGVPVKAVNEYLRRLVRHGFRVAICEQVEDPRVAKGIVRREVVETITPGVAFADDLLDGTRNNFVCAMVSRGEQAGLAAADVSTGELRLAVVPIADVRALIARLSPTEMVVPRGFKADGLLHHGDREEDTLVTEREGWEFDVEMARPELARQYRVHSLEGFGLTSGDNLSIGAAGALLRYLRELQPAGVPHLARPIVERPGVTMPVDEMTRRNLELVESMRGGDVAGTLLGVLDRTVTPMGARLLRQWVLTPLVDRILIESRLDAVQALARDPIARQALRDALDEVRDVERLAGKTAAGRATPRELGALGRSLGQLPAVEEAVRRVGPRGLLRDVLARWDVCADVAGIISETLTEHPPASIGEEPAIATGVDIELDELRAIRDGGRDGIAAIQTRERQRTGIASLKVGYNKVFGYYIEVTNANAHLVPDEYQRRQTLSGAERFVTTELKEFEEKILTAAERIETRERALFESLRSRVGEEVARLQSAALLLAQLDVLATLADVAEREGYTRPEMTDEFGIEIVGGRHPVVERMMPRDKFIPNDVTLTDDARLIILTGPNMAGKSTVLRQIGLIVLLAQMGSFVPATRARLGVVDRLFTRVGASDNLVRGQSTFMVEMSETSAILHTASRRSLVLLDEIGRGTSTYDGVSIAWAVSEYLHDAVACKTVFATHYHELTQLADTLQAARNLTVEVREVGEEVLFLHRLQPGAANRSYGIEVGRLAGLPTTVLARARKILHSLEGGHLVKDARPPLGQPDTTQLGLGLSMPHPVLERLRALDPDTMTPLQALQQLADFRKELS